MQKVFHETRRWIKTKLGGQTVFCNPPYGRQIYAWVEKSSKEKDCTVVMLLPARTDTKWFHDFIYKKAEIRFIRGRLHYNDAKDAAPFPSMIVVLRNKRNTGMGEGGERGMRSEWRQHYSSAFQNNVFYCPRCGMETTHETPYCCICGKKMLHESNEGQVEYSQTECGRDK